MCIAIVANKGKIVSEKYLNNCFDNNNDGAGFAFINSHGKVEISKGYFTFKTFYEDYLKVAGKSNMLIHFRIATSGGISGGCCHPFPVITNYKDMKKEHMTCESAMIHNGIISDCEPPAKAKYSDTMVFNRLFLADEEINFRNKKIQSLLEEFIGTSKVAVLSSDNSIVKLGKWIEEDGVFYSNDSYKDSYFRYFSRSNLAQNDIEICFATIHDWGVAEEISQMLESEGIGIIDYCITAFGLEMIVDMYPVLNSYLNHAWYVLYNGANPRKTIDLIEHKSTSYEEVIANTYKTNNLK